MDKAKQAKARAALDAAHSAGTADARDFAVRQSKELEAIAQAKAAATAKWRWLAAAMGGMWAIAFLYGLFDLTRHVRVWYVITNVGWDGYPLGIKDLLHFASETSTIPAIALTLLGAGFMLIGLKDGKLDATSYGIWAGVILNGVCLLTTFTLMGN